MTDEELELPDGTPAPEAEPKDSKPWLNLITEAEKAFETYNDKCDSLDKLYANLDRLSNMARDREMALFWANMQVLQPSIYARPPVPVVMPRFKDRRPIPRTTSELLERSAIVSFETGHIDRTLKLVRDNLARLARGSLWVRYEAKEYRPGKVGKKVCIDFKDRKDFLHDPARCWAEVDWVAGAAYLTKPEMRKRFKKYSGNAYQTAAYEIRKDDHDNAYDQRLKAKVWELWSRSANKVVWVSEGADKVLEDGPPHLDLEDFFPAPEPAYGTKQPNSLIPVPDMLQYKDQLEEINQLTNRIHSLADAIKVRGFYPAGAGEIGDAVEAAVKMTNDNQILIPVSNWAMLGQGNPNDMIVWLPIDQITATVAQLVELRRTLIQDVYEISGISDILRGQTDPNETLGAQELKAQTGSVRIKDKQEEIVRLSRDVTRIACEIMAEEFDAKTLLDMSQMELPTDAQIAQQVAQLEEQGARLKMAVEQAMQSPEVQQMAQEKPEEAQQAQQMAEQKAQELQGQIQKLKSSVTIDQVMGLLKDQKLRPFVLDIETDSTIVPDENAQKQRMTEYVTAMSGLLQQLIPAVQQVPQLAPVGAEIIKKANSTFRMGREFEQVVEEFAEQMKQAASQPKGPSPEQQKAEADAKAAEMAAQADGQRAQAETLTAQAEAKKAETEANEAQVSHVERLQQTQSKAEEEALQRQIKAQEAQDASAARQQELADKAAVAEMQRVQQAEAHAQKMEEGKLNIALLNTKIEQANVATDNSLKTTAAGVEATKAKAKQKPEAK